MKDLMQVKDLWRLSRARYSAARADPRHYGHSRREVHARQLPHPEGANALPRAPAELLRGKYARDSGAGNVAITNGSRTGFFVLLDMLSGELAEVSNRRVLFPLMPCAIAGFRHYTRQQAVYHPDHALRELGVHEEPELVEVTGPEFAAPFVNLAAVILTAL
ncbi:MAG: hypothetical protein ACLFO1_06440 [Spirochaetaceae bacterium]